MAIQISASILSANFLKLGEEIRLSEEAGVDSFHLDVMDGHMAPNLSYGPAIIQWIRKATSLPLDTHLMIDNPDLFADDYIKLGVQGLIVHAEAYGLEPVDPRQIKLGARFTNKINVEKLRQDLKTIKSKGVDASITFNLKTPVSVLKDVLDLCDSVLVMSIDPGFAGQKFMPQTYDKIRELRSVYKKDIKVDGGVNAETAPAVVAAGANVLISASYLYGSPDYKAAVQALKKA